MFCLKGCVSNVVPPYDCSLLSGLILSPSASGFSISIPVSNSLLVQSPPTDPAARGPKRSITKFIAVAKDAVKYRPPPQANPTAALSHVAAAVVIPWTR
jgi:hypothetical protein